MSESIGLSTAMRYSNRLIRVVRAAEPQGGVIGHGQLLECGVAKNTVVRWNREGRIHRYHPGVYAVGHKAVGLRGRLFAALLRRALPEADFLHLLDPTVVQRELGRGRAGSKALRAGLLAHLPELAHANEGVEQAFLLLCERHAIPIPEVNVYVEGLKVDGVWRDQRVIAELDSRLAHSQPAKVEADRHRDLVLRRVGYDVRRYTWYQVTRSPEAVIADLRAALS